MGIRKLLFGLNMKKVTFPALGFHVGDRHTHERLEHIVRLFASTYNIALDDAVPERVGAHVEEQVDLELRGFAHEAAAMAFAVIDMSRLSSKRLFVTYAHEVCPAHAYLAYIGGGVAHGAVRRNCQGLRNDLDPFSHWLVLDGRGFYYCFFRTDTTVRKHRTPNGFDEMQLRQFDAGIGRGLWFVECGIPARIEATIASFPTERQAAVWAGIGLAAAYAGGVDQAVLQELSARAANNITMLAQGVALAAHARSRAKNVAPQVELATEVVWGRSAKAVDEIAERCIASSLQENSAWPNFLARVREAYGQPKVRKVA